LVGALFVTIPRLLLSVFGMTDPLVADIGVQLIGFLAVSGLFVTVALTYSGGLQGTGDTKGPLYISIISQLVIPIGMCVTIDAVWGLEAVHIWLAIVIGHFTRASLSVIRFRQEKWRGIQVSIDPARR
jgi:Na+-driven multidrug efflux pump